ncbi:MAG: hypothetical protein CME64_04640 [Halobacteriovoraceae bacterium]|nr:hypothetical protein [Halobacteriovoraceae bacterium]|tara:strand:+ start:215842 stop:216609 length:768 start_codon:yes stop_codon:yes gene_type:complete
MRLAAFLTLFILCSCSDQVELKSKSGIYFLKDVEVELKDLKEVDWKVGKNREELVSKGIQFKLEVPSLEDSASKILKKSHGIDSWIFRISKVSNGPKRHLGYVAFDTKKGVTQNLTVHLYYHAASVSHEFRKFRCPAFNHRLRVTDFDIEERVNNKRRDDIYIRPKDYVNGKVDQLSFSPLIYSAGQGLKGKYLVEIALFNLKESRTYSNWIPIDQVVNVDGETLVKVKSCYGVSEETSPYRERRKPRLEDLRIR